MGRSNRTTHMSMSRLSSPKSTSPPLISNQDSSQSLRISHVAGGMILGLSLMVSFPRNLLRGNFSDFTQGFLSAVILRQPIPPKYKAQSSVAS